jgi:ribosomal protein S27AE
MMCPGCGVEMNHHGDKLVYTTDPQDAGQADSGLGGIIEEFHACPKCGGGASRHA